MRDLRDRVERLQAEDPAGLVGRATARALRLLVEDGRAR
jgi:hypothetical protein